MTPEIPHWMKDFGQAGRLVQLADGLPARDGRIVRNVARKLTARVPLWNGEEVSLPVGLWEQSCDEGVAVWLRVSVRDARTPDRDFAPGAAPDTVESFQEAVGHARAFLARTWGTSGLGAAMMPRFEFLAPAGAPLPRTVEGRSASAAAAVAALALLSGWALPPGTCVLGEVLPDGRLKPVEHTPRKREALVREKMGVTAFWVVEEEKDAGQDAGPVPFHRLPPADGVEGLFRAILPDCGDVPPPLLRALPPGELERMVVHLERAQKAAALEHMRQMLTGGDLPPHLAFLLDRALGAVYSRQGNIARALAGMETAARQLDSPAVRDRLEPTEASELYNNLGVLATDLHRWEEALAWFGRARRELDGVRGRAASRGRAMADSSEGQLWMWRGEPERAESLLRQARDVLNEPQNLNYLAGALVLSLRQARRRGEAANPSWAAEARESLAESARRADFANEHAARSHRRFIDYWRARLECESGGPAPDEPERAEGGEEKALFPEGHGGSPYPRVLTWSWRLGGPAGAPFRDRPLPPDMAAGLRELFDPAPGSVLPLLALGATLRLWACPAWRAGLLEAWRPAEGSGRGPGTAAASAPGAPAAVVPLADAVLDRLAPLSPALAARRDELRALPADPSPAGEERLAAFLDRLAETIAY